MAWDKTKPAFETAIVSADIRDNWAAIETAVGINTGILIPRAIRRIAQDLTDHATSGTGATDVWSSTLGAGALANGETLVLEAYGDMTIDSNNKTYSVVLGSTTFNVGVRTENVATWVLRVRISRVSQLVQRALVETIPGGGNMVAVYQAATEDLDASNTLKVTLTHATSGTTTLKVVRAWIETVP